jgi:hypothetical protein
MDKNILLKIVVLLSLLSLLACDSSSGGSSDGGTTDNPPELENVDPAANDSSVLRGAAITATFDKEPKIKSVRWWKTIQSSLKAKCIQPGSLL